MAISKETKILERRIAKLEKALRGVIECTQEPKVCKCIVYAKKTLDEK